MAITQRPTVATQLSEPATPFHIRVRLYSYPRDGIWYAEAPEMSLIAIGDSESEAIDALKHQIIAYLQTVISRGWMEQIHRPASLRHRLEVKLRVALAKLRRQPAFVRVQLVSVP